MRNPNLFLKKNQSIKLHFDVFHGEGFLDRALECLEDKEKDDFKNSLTKILHLIEKIYFFVGQKS